MTTDLNKVVAVAFRHFDRAAWCWVDINVPFDRAEDYQRTTHEYISKVWFEDDDSAACVTVVAKEFSELDDYKSTVRRLREVNADMLRALEECLRTRWVGDRQRSNDPVLAMVKAAIAKAKAGAK